jgi:hypothetical protein
MKKIYNLKIIFTVLYLFFAPKLSAQQPIGATPGNPIQVILTRGITYTDTQNNNPINGFGNDFGQPSDDIIYKFTLTASSEVNVSHCGSAFDTYLYVLDPQARILASNDDYGPFCTTLQASLTVKLNPGTYYIVSEGYSSNFGSITTSISLGKPMGANISYPIDAGIFTTPRTYVNTQNNATINGYGNDYGQLSDDIYYKFKVVRESDVDISHCASAFDTYVHLLDSTGNLLYSNDDAGPLCATPSASLRVTLSPGTYFVVSEGYSNKTGSIITNITLQPVKTFQEEADYVLANLSMVPVTTGVLYDKTFPLANLEDYKGLATDPLTNSDHFLQAYTEMYDSKLNKTGTLTPVAFNDYLKTNYDKNNHTLGIFAYKYQYLDTNAVKNNQLFVSNGQLYDTPNRTTAPYIEATSIFVTPLFPAETEIEAGDHYFSYDPQTIFKNTTFDIASVTVNFDDGQGNQVLYSGTSSSRISLQSSGFLKKLATWTGKKFFLVRAVIVLTDGRTYESVSKVFTKDKSFKTEVVGCNGGTQFDIIGSKFNGAAYGKGLESANGRAYVFYSNANCGTNKITKPVIFIDGFDPVEPDDKHPPYKDNSRDAQQIYDDYINKEVRMNGQFVKLGDKLRADGYDIIVYDYENGGDLIEKNALAVVELTQELYRRYSTTLQKDFVLIGPSMGALVAQYALAYAEKNNINTHTRLYISFDGPHKGANGPIGVQQFADYIFQKNLVGALFPRIRSGLHRVSSARQMLIHNSTVESETPQCDNYRNIFLRNLATVGKYPNALKDPSKIRKIAIINGSNSLASNEYLQPQSEMMYLRVKRRGLLGFVNGRLGDRVNISINASPAVSRETTTDVWLFKPILNLALLKAPRKRYYTNPAPSNKSYDAGVGSYFGDPIVEGSRSDAIISSVQTLLYLFGGNTSDFRHNINPTFMHSTSAIDLQTLNNPLEYNFKGEDISCSNKTPFDRVYAPAKNQVHVQLTDENAVWFDNEIKDTPQPITYQSAYPISGQNEICTTAVYTVPNLPAGRVPTWSTTGNVSIVGSNIGNSVTVTSASGTGNLTATTINACGNTEVTSKATYKGPPPNSTFTTNPKPNVNGGSSLRFTAVYQVDATYEWKLDGAVMASTSSTFAIIGGNCSVNPLKTSYSVQLRVTNSCGLSSTYCRNYTYNCTGGFTDRGDCSSGGPLLLRISDGSFTYYPNPANNELIVSYLNNPEELQSPSEFAVSKEVKDFEIELYDDNGKKVKSTKNNPNEKDIIINTQNLPNGNYFLHILDGKEIFKKQIIIQH